MELNERMAVIDEDIHDQFSSVTDLRLQFGTGFSQITCELCLRSLQLASAVKCQFIENQRKLNSINCSIKEEKEPPNEAPPVQTTASTPRRRKREPRKTQQRNTEDFIDPLQFLSVQESNEEFDSYNNPPTSPKEQPTKEEPAENEEPMVLEIIKKPRRERKRTAEQSPQENGSRSTNSEYNTPSEPVQRGFKCPHCSNVYKRKPHMSRHIEVSHMKVKFICVVPGCSQYFVRKERLRKHIETCHDELVSNEMALMLEQVRHLKPVYGTSSMLDADDKNGNDEDNHCEEGSSSFWNLNASDSFLKRLKMS